MDIAKIIETVYEEAVQIRRHIHMHPEKSEEEKCTADYICSVLDKYEIPCKRNIAGHGITALISGSGTSCVGIRADMDALPIQEKTGLSFASQTPGLMHACGHDMHIAILLGTGIVLKQLESQLLGKVKLIFQPAEETIGGAKRMIEEGALTDPPLSCILGLHMDPDNESGSIALRSGAMNAAVNDYEIRIQGKQCHGAHPDAGIDPIVVTADIITALQTIASRFTSPTVPVIVTIGQIHGGTQNNIIPDQVTLSGTLRTLDKTVTEATVKKLEQLVLGIASGHGASAEVTWDDTAFPPLINDDEVIKTITTAMEPHIGQKNIHHMKEPSLGGDDFAFFSSKVPGAYFNLGCTKKGDICPPLHNPLFSPDERSIYTGICAEVYTALALLGNKFD